MVTDFNGFNKGVIGKKLPSDTTLNNMKKADLIELLHTAQHNYESLSWFYNRAVDNSKCNTCPLGMPIAYNVEKVVAELEELANHNGNAYLDSADVIDIVKRGGVE